ncbi:MAG: TIGR02147 family protein [Fibrobacterota bacterium]|nr:TIGR02147 family protein [Fibrobacterota bacterium]QQS06725.1 MAG: TIGR02147 family protein [Fibrobacterota bacterium]
MPDIFAYTEYRKYLTDAWTERKAQDPRFSHRFIVQRAGFNSSAFFSRILTGDVNLTPSGALRLAEVFHLGTHETRYFELLVLLDQARSHEEKMFFADRLASWRRVPVSALDSAKATFCQDWRAVAVLETLEIIEHSDDHEKLGSFLVPPASGQEVASILALLAELGLASRNIHGIWRKTERFISADEVDTESVNQFRRDTIDLAREALDRFEREDRSISTLTATVSKASFERVRDRLRQLRREILELSRADDQADRVLQVNLQAFPLVLLDGKVRP